MKTEFSYQASFYSNKHEAIRDAILSKVKGVSNGKT